MNGLLELYISADSHVVEPKELWLTRMDKRFRDRAPRIQSRPDGDYFAIEGVEPFSISPLGAMIQDEVAGREVSSRAGKRAEDIRAGAWQASARLADQQMDHIRAEVLYPGYGLVMFGAPDPEYQLACFQCYNDWLSEFCVELDRRALGAAVLPGNCPIEVMIKEAERIVRKPGLRSVMLVNNPVGRPYSSPVYDPFWAAISDSICRSLSTWAPAPASSSKIALNGSAACTAYIWSITGWATRCGWLPSLSSAR
jgi:predicted TIM-barrel fold metal-dependent hydrolase